MLRWASLPVLGWRRFGQEAGCAAASGHGQKGRGFDAAPVKSMGAAVGEMAALGILGGRGDLAWNEFEPFAPALGRRNGFEQAAGVGVKRIVEQCADRAFLDNARSVHDYYALAQLPDHAHVVGDEQDGGLAPLHRQHELENLGANGHVKRCCGLVGQDEVGLVHERHGDHDALALAAGALERP